MNNAERRAAIISVLGGAKAPVSASSLAERFNVSRQVIVGDIALLRAGGLDILSTPRGYCIASKPAAGSDVFRVACVHSPNDTSKELYIVVDNGGVVLDVIVEHPVYGQLTGRLNISSRYDADVFLQKLETEGAGLLSGLTDGIHIHTISCADGTAAERIRNALMLADMLLT